MKKSLVSAICILAVAVLAVGCSQKPAPDANADANANQEPAAPAEQSGNDLSGSVTMAGSTSMEKLATAANAAFMDMYPNVTAQAEFTGSGAGIEAVTSGMVDIGNASRALKDEEKASGIVENIVAIDGIAVVTHPSNSVADLTSEQLASIFTGAVSNWSEVGGADEPIVVIGREAGSGTRGAFEELVDIEEKTKYAQEIDSTGAVMAKVAATPGSIGYVSVDVINESVRVLSVDTVAPEVKNIKDGTYVLSRPFVMATKGEISAQSEAVQAFFAFLASDAGQEIITQQGLITVD